MEPFQPKLGVCAAAIEPLVTPPPAFDMLVFDPEGCITQGAALRSTVAKIGAAIESGDHLRSPVTNRARARCPKDSPSAKSIRGSHEYVWASGGVENRTIMNCAASETGINDGATRSPLRKSTYGKWRHVRAPFVGQRTPRAHAIRPENVDHQPSR
jgi:hypothetical protein